MDRKKAHDILALAVGQHSSLADYFVLCDAQSSTQVSAIADDILESMQKAGFRPLHLEGYRSAVWVLLDFGDVVAHVFTTETRQFYNIERLWDDAEQVELGLGE